MGHNAIDQNLFGEIEKLGAKGYGAVHAVRKLCCRLPLVKRHQYLSTTDIPLSSTGVERQTACHPRNHGSVITAVTVTQTVPGGLNRQKP